MTDYDTSGEEHFDEEDTLDSLEAAIKDRETKNEAFLRLANQRLPVTVKRIRLLKNLASKTNYEYRSEQVAVIIATLRYEVDQLEAAFETDEASIPVIE